MPDDRRDEEEFRITVRDRRRVTTEGELREVEDEEAAAPPPPPPAAPPTPPPAERPRPTGGALGGTDEARIRRGQHLREVAEPEEIDELDEDDLDDEPGGPRQPRDLYEYTQVLALGMLEWSVSACGLTPNPLTRIVMTDMEQAEFGIQTAETLYDLLLDKNKIGVEARIGFCQSFIINFAQIAAQILQQPPGVRLQEMGKVRFCIDVADRFLVRLREVPDDSGRAQLEQLDRFLTDVRLTFVQLSGGGGIIG